jgi:hypothetical protein
MPEVQHVIVAVVLIIAMYFILRPKPRRLRDEWRFSLIQEFFRLRTDIKKCRGSRDLEYMEEKIDDMYNEYKGKVNDVFLTGYTNQLYGMISNKAIELK